MSNLKFRHWLGFAGVAAAIASIPVHFIYGWAFALMCVGTAGLCISFATLMIPDEEDDINPKNGRRH